MKLSEVIAEMEKGSTKTYGTTTAKGTKIKTKRTEEGCFPIAGYLSLDYDWQPISQPVSWQEAIQAWADGKTIRLVMPEWEQVWKPTNAISFNYCQITQGSWYVED